MIILLSSSSTSVACFPLFLIQCPSCPFNPIPYPLTLYRAPFPPFLQVPYFDLLAPPALTSYDLVYIFKAIFLFFITKVGLKKTFWK